MRQLLGTAAKIAPASGTAAVVANAAASAAADKAISGAQKAHGVMSDAAGAISQITTLGKDRAQQFTVELKASLERWIKAKVYAKVEQLMEKLPPLAKDLLEDPEMPRCVSRGKDRIVDAIWPDIKDEIVWEVALLLDGREPADEESDETPGACCLLAFLRYHLYPYDKGFWGKLRDPWWILFTLITMIPVLGVSPMCFFFVFLIIDRGDEYQLIQFILQFKGTQFISVGLLRMIVGYFLYVLCVTAPAEPDEHKCDEGGPGNQGSIILTSIGMVLQEVLTWTAFVLLSCSVAKGRRKLKGDIGAEEVGKKLHKKGGYIKWLLFYDLFIFLIVLGILAWVQTTVDEYDAWPVKHAIYGLQIAYGLLAFPFFFFTLPFLQLVLTHSVPTAYDRKGRCKKPSRPPAREEKRAAEEEQSQGKKRLPLVSDIDVAEIVDKIKDLLPDQVSTMISAGKIDKSENSSI